MNQLKTLTIASCILCASAHAETQNFEFKLLHTLQHPDDQFGVYIPGFNNTLGREIAGDGQTVIGIDAENTTEMFAFDLSNGTESQLFHPDAGGGNADVVSLTLNEDYIVAGAGRVPISGTKEGRVYVYDRTTHALLRTFESPLDVPSNAVG